MRNLVAKHDFNRASTHKSAKDYSRVRVGKGILEDLMPEDLEYCTTEDKLWYVYEDILLNGIDDIPKTKRMLSRLQDLVRQFEAPTRVIETTEEHLIALNALAQHTDGKLQEMFSEENNTSNTISN